jgi:hypothetical protein
MDLNLSRRKREMSIAHEVAGQLLREVTMPQAAQPELLAHHFALTCERLGVLLDTAGVGRVLGYTVGEIKRKQRQFEGVQTQLDRINAVFAKAR